MSVLQVPLYMRIGMNEANNIMGFPYPLMPSFLPIVTSSCRIDSLTSESPACPPHCVVCEGTERNQNIDIRLYRCSSVPNAAHLGQHDSGLCHVKRRGDGSRNASSESPTHRPLPGLYRAALHGAPASLEKVDNSEYLLIRYWQKET